jgi:methylated-DNA-[protein]-cysteine S-methyltransferase
MIRVMATRHDIVPTSIGELTVVVDTVEGGDVLVGLYLPGHWTLPDVATFGPREPGIPLVAETVHQLEEYLAGERHDFDLPVELRGSEYYQAVWAILRETPYGERITYGQIAARLGTSAQPVGRAVGANPLSVVVPCHRVVGSDGSLTGYAGGIERKRALLELEEPSADERGALF